MNCMHSCIAPNMNRCIKCGAVWRDGGWVEKPLPAEPARAAFETWLQGTSGWKKCAKRGTPMYLRTHINGEYADFRVNDRWHAWKAALSYKEYS